MNWLHYLLEANIYLGIFYIAYCLFLNKETHYVLNRIYLVCSCVIAFILPILQLGVLIPPPPPMQTTAFIPVQVTNIGTVATAPIAQPQFNWQDGLWYIYLAGAAICLILFIVKLISLIKLIIGKPVLKHTNYNLIYINDTNTAFSFFNYLFIGKNAPDKNIITRHELVHIRQMHSADIVFLETLKIISWFNPLIYLIQDSLKTVHEYIADEQSVDSKDDAIAYSSFLVNNAYGLTGPSITHSFFTYNLLKKRIIMLNQQRSGNLARLKYLVAVPIGAALLCASTLGFSKTYGWIDLAPQKPVNTQVQYREAPPTVMEEGPYTGFVKHLSNNLHFPASLKNKNFSVTVIASFELDKNGLIKNVSTNTIKSYPEISNDIVTAIESYKKPINDKFGGKRFMVLNFAAKNTPPPPFVDSKIGSDPGNLGTYLITDAPNSKLEIIKYPPPRVVPDNQVPPKPKVDKVKFPVVLVPAGFKPEKTYVNAKGYKIQEGIGHTKTNFTYYVVIISDPAGKDLTLANDGSHKRYIAYKGMTGAEKTAYNLYGYKFLDVKVSKFVGPPPTKPDVVRFPPPIGELKVADKRLYNSKTHKWITLHTPPKPKVDQVRFPPPIIYGDKSAIPHDFTAFLAKNIRYPTDARENGIVGNVVAEFKIDENNHIAGSRILQGIGHGCDQEVLRAIAAYTGDIKARNATYIIGISFEISYGDNTPPPAPVKPISNKIKSAPYYIGEIVIIGYGTVKK